MWNPADIMDMSLTLSSLGMWGSKLAGIARKMLGRATLSGDAVIGKLLPIALINTCVTRDLSL